MSTWTSEVKGPPGPPGHRSSLSALAQKLAGPYPNPHDPLAGSQRSSLTIRRRRQLSWEKDQV